MTDELDDVGFQPTEGGVVARHPARQPLALFSTSTSSAVIPQELNVVQEDIHPVACMRMDEIRFEFNSSFVAPGVQRELKLLARLRADIPGMPVSVFGHADPVGNDDLNKKLSGRRAAAVYALLTRNTAIWEDINKQKGEFTNPLPSDNWGIASVQVMLTTLGHYSGPMSGQLDGDTRAAVQAFQRSPQGAGLDDDGDPGRLTRPKLYRAYMDRICVDDSGAPFELDPAADFVAHGADPKGKGDYEGCSEFNPVLVFSRSEDAAFRSNPDKTERNQENLPNRRVLLFLFRPGFSISPANWPCPRARDGFAACKGRFFRSPPNGDTRRNPQDERREYRNTRNTFACRFYDRLAIESPCEIGGPVIQTVLLRVHLRLAFRDPLNVERVFPPNFPVTVLFPDGDTINEHVGADGYVTFVVDRRKQSFTLTFDFAEDTYVGSAPSGAAAGLEPERLLNDSTVGGAVGQGYRVFMVPRVMWTTRNSDWAVTGAPTYAGGDFRQLPTVGALGSAGAPVRMVLNPHWQYMKFLYFDRKLRRKLSIPPIMVDGFDVAELAAGPPDTRSNWTTSQGCQCLPWIMQDPPKPNDGVLVQFRTAARSDAAGRPVPGTFIDSSSGSARLVTSSAASGGSGSDPGLNQGSATNRNFEVAEAARLSFYDLPPVWKSRDYFAQFFTAAGAASNKHGRFQALAADPTTDARPHLFSLDDMVLVDHDLDPVAWNPASDRVAVFSHRLYEGVSVGLHRPDSNQPYLSLPPTLVTDRNYLAEYPDWTRLVTMGGNLYDVFDKRTPDVDARVVGARAAARVMDATVQLPGTSIWVRQGTSDTWVSAPAGTPPMAGNHVAGHTTPTPPGPNPPGFCVVQPFFKQEHCDQENPDPPRATPYSVYNIGRFDMAVLRCCDVDGADEVAAALQYYRFNFNFNPAFKASFNPNAVPLGLTGGAAQAHINTTLQNIFRRWNGPDGTYHPGGTLLLPEGASAPSLKVRVVWFAQHLPKNVAHFEIGVFRHPNPDRKVRAYMSSYRGEGGQDRSDKEPVASGHVAGRFVAAHETGHAGSLHDEYVETSTTASYYQLGFPDSIPGSPYALDERSMMEADYEVRPRCYWHVAEWLRSLYAVRFRVKHGSFQYRLLQNPDDPQNAQRRSLVSWPLARALNATVGTRGKFDANLYPFGDEPYNNGVLGPGRFDGIVCVVVRMVFSFMHTNSHETIRDAVDKVFSGVDREFNDRSRRQFSAAGSARGQSFSRCLLHFSPRFLVRNLSNNQDYKDVMGVKPDPGPPPRTEAEVYRDKVRAIISERGMHFEVEMTNRGRSRWASRIVPTPTGIGFETKTVLEFNMDDDDPADVFPRFFANMIGLADGTMNAPSSYLPVARTVFPTGTVTVQRIT